MASNGAHLVVDVDAVRALTGPRETVVDNVGEEVKLIRLPALAIFLRHVLAHVHVPGWHKANPAAKDGGRKGRKKKWALGGGRWFSGT